MTRDQALRFLRAHQPLPVDRAIPAATLRRFEEVRRHLLAHPSRACIAPLLGALGKGDGRGVYPLVAEVLAKLPRRDVVAGLAGALASKHRSVQLWSARFAARLPSPDLVAPLLQLLGEDDFDLKYAALTALEQSATRDTADRIADYAAREHDPELHELADDLSDRLYAS